MRVTVTATGISTVFVAVVTGKSVDFFFGVSIPHLATSGHERNRRLTMGGPVGCRVMTNG